jgi:hypothetical protein
VYGPSTTAPFKAGEYKVTATSTDPNYTGSQDENFAISKATPSVTTKPTASGINLGQALSSSSLSGGVASSGGNTVPGSFAFTNATETLTITADRPVIFNPTDTANYNTISTTVTVTVNQPPTLSGVTVSGTEDTIFAFSRNIFAGAFSDPEETALASVTIQSLPSKGALKLGAAYVTLGQVISANQLDGLTYAPEENDNTASGQKRKLDVTASDGALSSKTATVEIGLDPVNDAPTMNDFILTGNEDETLMFSVGALAIQNPYSDPDGDKMSSLRIVELPETGTAKLGSAAVQIGQVIPRDQLGNLAYEPVADENGSKVLKVIASDGELDSGVARSEEHTSELQSRV